MSLELNELINNFIEERRDILDNPGYDCSERAEDIVEYIRPYKYKAEVLQFSTSDFTDPYSSSIDLIVPEKGDTKEYTYHCVALINDDIVVDIFNLPFVKLEDYKKTIEDLNKGKKIIYKILNF